MCVELLGAGSRPWLQVHLKARTRTAAPPTASASRHSIGGSKGCFDQRFGGWNKKRTLFISFQCVFFTIVSKIPFFTSGSDVQLGRRIAVETFYDPLRSNCLERRPNPAVVLSCFIYMSRSRVTGRPIGIRWSPSIPWRIGSILIDNR